MDEKPAEAVRAKPRLARSSAPAARSPTARPTRSSRPGTRARCSPPGLLELRRLPGVMRPAIAVPIPTQQGPSVLLDCGANADARPEHLLQFALHGRGLRRGDPRAPSARGAPALDRRGARRRATSSRSRRTRCSPASDLNFAGNAESRDLLAGAADVVVCDGFTGNVALKLLEGTIKDAARRPARRDRRHGARQARRPAHPAGRAPAADAARPRHVRRRLPARPARARGDRARHSSRPRDRERDPPRGARGRARRRRPARGAAARDGRDGPANGIAPRRRLLEPSARGI